MDLDELRGAIRAAGARWEAAVTPISERAPAAGNGLFGLALDEPEREQLLAEADRLEAESGRLAGEEDVPAGADWRTRDVVSPARDQGVCGACVAFATCACLEARAAFRSGQDASAFDFSEGHLFSCGAPGRCEEGWRPDEALNWARVNGIGREDAFPYTAQDEPCRAVPAVVRVTSWSAATSTEQRKRVLAFHGPVVGAMRVFEDFPHYRQGIYSHVAGRQLALHAVCVVGYDDAEGFWIVKNSWSPNWGDQGFGRIAYGECGIDSEFPFYDPDLELLG